MRTLKKQMGSLKQFFTSDVIADEDGVGVVEIILILVGIHTTPQPIVLC